MTILFTLVNLILMALLALRASKRLGKGSVYWIALFFKLTCGILLGLLYMYYYKEGDTIALFNDAVKLSDGHSESLTTGPRSFFFVYIIRIVNLVTYNNYWLTSLWFSLFSFLGSYRLVLKLGEVFPSLQIASRVALLFLPSVVFWTSGIIKECLAFGAVAILSLYFISFMRDEKITWKAIVEILLSLILLLSLKYYWAAVLLPCMITAFIVKRFSVVWYLPVFVFLCLTVSFTHPNFHLGRFLSVIVDNHNMYTEGQIRYNNLTPDWISILINSPLALFSGLFRPLINFSSLPITLASLENLTILGLFIWKIKFIRLPLPENRLLVFSVLIYIFVLCIFLALSTPNLGTLSRYRVGFLPFFVLLILADHPILNFINEKSSHHIRS